MESSHYLQTVVVGILRPVSFYLGHHVHSSWEKSLKRRMQYIKDGTGIQGVTQGHIHSGTQGENGPIVVNLFNFESPQSDVLLNGTFAATNLEGLMEGKEIPDLITAMQNGTTYVNVHTEQNPDGEIREQLVDIP